MPLIGFGTAGLTENTAQAVTWALEAGYRLLDSAQAREWYREDLVGEALKGTTVPRSSLFLTSKCELARSVLQPVALLLRPLQCDPHVRTASDAHHRCLFRRDVHKRLHPRHLGYNVTMAQARLSAPPARRSAGSRVLPIACGGQRRRRRRSRFFLVPCRPPASAVRSLSNPFGTSIRTTWTFSCSTTRCAGARCAGASSRRELGRRVWGPARRARRCVC